jgi:hypothetical protein
MPMAGPLDHPEPIRCPKCLADAGRFLSPVSRITGQDYYECTACHHVWTDTHAPDSSTESSNGRVRLAHP